jgi:hypothetical protein
MTSGLYLALKEFWKSVQWFGTSNHLYLCMFLIYANYTSLYVYVNFYVCIFANNVCNRVIWIPLLGNR